MVNKVIIIGHLGADPERRATQGGDTVVSFRVACTERWKDKNGGDKEHTEWVSVTVWGRQAEVCATYLAKGRQVYVEGRIRTEKWTDKQGVERYTTKIQADNVRFLGGKGAGGGSAEERPRGESDGRRYLPPGNDEDIPF